MYQNTTVSKTKISDIDGEQGKLLYRGYSLEELAKKSTFLEVAHLLIYGSLPNEAEFKHWYA